MTLLVFLQFLDPSETPAEHFHSKVGCSLDMFQFVLSHNANLGGTDKLTGTPAPRAAIFIGVAPIIEALLYASALMKDNIPLLTTE